MKPIERVVIVGGGTAGWMAAAAAARFLDDGQRTITLIESEAIGTVGVGEATIPPIRGFNARLGIDEAEFLCATGGTPKLGIEFVDWAAPGESYFHPFGTYGRDIEGLNFHQLWLKLRNVAGVGGIEEYAMSAVAARAGRFALPSRDARSPLAGLEYAYHFDAGLYADLLRRRAVAEGVTRVEGRIVGLEKDAQGYLSAVRLEGDRQVTGDLFIDCSGFRSLLLGEAMGVSFEDWSYWLPCDRAIAVPCEATSPLSPYTRASAHGAGWQWRIPLQHRTGNGLVYASAHMSDEEAERTLLAHIDARATAAPRHLAFKAGRRKQMWCGNVIALGLAAGFLEPLESTSIHLVQDAISKLLALFPDRRFTAVERDEFNRLMANQYASIRDFIILHYAATLRNDTPFWQHVRTMDLPETLARKIALFREKGRIFRYDDELFAIPSWVAVMLGQGIVPNGYDPVVDALDDDRLVEALRQLRVSYADAARNMPLVRSGLTTPPIQTV